jgi:hypothetical protein
VNLPHNKWVCSAHRTGVRCTVLVYFLFTSLSGWAQVRPYAGVIGGIATLSADGGSQPIAGGLSLSSYAPANGGALNIFVGADLHNYFSVQGNFIGNRNSLHLNSASSVSGTFYQEDRSSSQRAAVLDFLIYFRKRSSRIRPYLGTGGGVVYLSSTLERLVAVGGSPSLPPTRFSSTGPVFRSHVGIDIRIWKRLSFRYSFSELISRNPISKELSPPGPRGLANFQNLFGFVTRF